MRTEDELRTGCANILYQLRQEMGYSKNKMAEALGISYRTYERYEHGKAAPRVDEFIRYFDLFHADALRYVLEYLYPDVYEHLTANSDIDDIRHAAVHYTSHIASDRAVRKLCYLVFGEHGSNIEAQSEGFLILDHLPLTMRLAVASLVHTLYEVALAHDLLVQTDCIMPKVEIFQEGLRKGHAAVMAGRNSYTTSTVKNNELYQM